MLIEAMTMKDFDEEVKKTRTVIIPFGSVEEHGEHLPLGTDTIQAYEIASRVGKKIPVFVCPPVYYGLCRSSGKHPGTISIKGSTLRSLVIDIVESLYSQGLRTFLLFSGHAGGTHLAMILDAAEELLERFNDISIGVISYLDIADEAWKGDLECQKDSHAGESETSLMMVLRSGWVKGTSPEEYPTFPKYVLVRDKRSYWQGGVWGDPGKASKEKGERLLEKAVDFLVKVVKQLEEFRRGNPSDVAT
ncbi:MAG TPA: creatininase family protein [Deltaproteobacteria bacterium]|nr:creatininase family protein [Deltaproteobacteria bacterium]